MKQPTLTLAAVERALAAQDQKLAASCQNLDPRAPLTVPLASLRRLAEVCASPRAWRGRVVPIGRHAVRC